MCGICGIVYCDRARQVDARTLKRLVHPVFSPAVWWEQVVQEQVVQAPLELPAAPNAVWAAGASC